MPLKTLIVISGTVIASAVTALPILAPGEPVSVERALPVPNVVGAPLDRKGDRLRVLDEACSGVLLTAACADIYGAAGLHATLTIERRVGESTSVLIRIPLSPVASR